MQRTDDFHAGRVAFDLATLHGEHRRRGTLVTHHHLELRADDIGEHHRIDRHRRGACARAQQHFPLQRILDGLDGNVAPDKGHIDRRGDPADPIELRDFEPDVRRAQPLL